MTPGLHEALTYLDSLRAADPEPISGTPITLLPDVVRDRVEARLRAGQEDARKIIVQHRSAVELVADALLDHRELDGAAIAVLLAETNETPREGV